MIKFSELPGKLETLSPAQLAGWYNRLAKTEMQINRITMLYRKYKGSYAGVIPCSPRWTVAMMASSVVIISGVALNNLWGNPFPCGLTAGVTAGLVIYFLITKRSSLPKNEKQHLISLIKQKPFPADSIFSALTFSPECTAEMVANQMHEAIRKEKYRIERMPAFQCIHLNAQR